MRVRSSIFNKNKKSETKQHNKTSEIKKHSDNEYHIQICSFAIDYTLNSYKTPFTTHMFELGNIKFKVKFTKIDYINTDPRETFDRTLLLGYTLDDGAASTELLLNSLLISNGGRAPIIVTPKVDIANWALKKKLLMFRIDTKLFNDLERMVLYQKIEQQPDTYLSIYRKFTDGQPLADENLDIYKDLIVGIYNLHNHNHPQKTLIKADRDSGVLDLMEGVMNHPNLSFKVPIDVAKIVTSYVDGDYIKAGVEPDYDIEEEDFSDKSSIRSKRA